MFNFRLWRWQRRLQDVQHRIEDLEEYRRHYERELTQIERCLQQLHTEKRFLERQQCDR